MNSRKLTKKLKELSCRVTDIEDKKLISSAADKIEQFQRLIDDTINDHYIDTLEFYAERCQSLEEDFTELAMESEKICRYCKNNIECKGKKCDKYIEGKGCWDDKRCYHDWIWSCEDFNFGTCDMLENTPCNGCFENNNRGFEWRGNNV